MPIERQKTNSRKIGKNEFLPACVKQIHVEKPEKKHVLKAPNANYSIIKWVPLFTQFFQF